MFAYLIECLNVHLPSRIYLRHQKSLVEVSITYATKCLESFIMNILLHFLNYLGISKTLSLIL
jgi:hypothetical protein